MVIIKFSGYNSNMKVSKSLVMKVSKQWRIEEQCRTIFEDIYKKPFPSVWGKIRNPLTRSKMQLDGYNEELGIAFEYNGRQHYEYPNHWHKSRIEFKRQQYRDSIKREQCERLGIKLIEIPYTESSNLREYIIKCLNI